MIAVEDIPRPSPAPGEVLVRVAAAGVAPWDALIREGKSKVSPPPPLTLGSDLSGVVEAVGPGVSQFKNGDEIYGVTNAQFVGANAEFAVASASMLASKPPRLTRIEAASIPVVAVTAWQMLFEHARPDAGQRVMVLGAAGNVGASTRVLGNLTSRLVLEQLNVCGSNGSSAGGKRIGSADEGAKLYRLPGC